MKQILYLLFFIFSYPCYSKNETVWEKFKVFESFGLKSDFTTKEKEDLVCPPGFRYKAYELLDHVKPSELFLFQCVNEQNKHEKIVLTYKPSNVLNQILYINHLSDKDDCLSMKELLLKHLDSVEKFEKSKSSVGWHAWGTFKGFRSKVQCEDNHLMIPIWRKDPL